MRLTTTKPLSLSPSPTADAKEIIKQISLAERRYQEELTRGFAALSEGAFKGLRRQLPVTRQKVEWDKIGSYRVSALLFPTVLFGGWGVAWVGHGADFFLRCTGSPGYRQRRWAIEIGSFFELYLIIDGQLESQWG